MVDQIGLVLGEEGMLDEGDGGDQGGVADGSVIMTKEGMNSGEDRRAGFPERSHRVVPVEETPADDEDG
ncbi:hypothetical protein [Streptomyces hydrogenans]|uniref:hypothetical protein n=1 Tax=Streptomyces hydrogenans TaxID=1873719 RepID=UPI0036B7FAE8